MYAITQSLYKLARSMGVLFYFNTRVDKISHDGNKAKGVVAAGEKHEADLVVCNMDITHAYRKLLPDIKEPASITNQSKSSSGIVFYWGIRKEFPELHLHNIFFSSNYKKEFEYIFNKGTVYSDPTVYINITSKLKKDDAPKGCENWFVMINVPHNCGQNWSELIAFSKANVLRKLSARLQSDIEPLIETEDILHPILIEQRTSSHLGAIYGSNSNSRYAAFLRHANFSSRLKSLYFCGGSVHPGGGIPLSLLSAKIVATLIDEIEK
jgi:phytoene desaturase